MKITKDMLLSDILGSVTDPEAVVALLQGMGMHCLGCAMRNQETLEDACAMHGADVDELVEKINQYC